MIDQKNLENLFSGGSKRADKVILSDGSKSIINNIQEDVDFIESIKEVKEHSKTTQKEIFAKRAHLTDEEYEFVQKTGKVHYQAQIFNESSSKEFQETDPPHRCKCGCKRAFGDPLPFCINEQEQAFFGPGIILFFFYVKRIFVVVLTCVLLYGIFSLTTNLASQATKEDCSSPGALFFLCEWKVLSEIDNKTGQDEIMIGQLCLGFLMCFIWSVAVRFIRTWGRIKNKRIDDDLDSSSDYNIFLEKLPVGEYHEEELLEYIEGLWNQLEESKDVKLKIKSVKIIYDMEEVRKKISKIHKLAREISHYIHKKKRKNGYQIKAQNLQVYMEKKKLILKKEAQLRQYRKNFIYDKEFRSKLTSECALIQFSVSRQMQIFLNKYGKHRRTLLLDIVEKLRNCCFHVDDSLLFKGKTINITKAPEPSDIFWMHCEKKDSLGRTLLVWFINFCLNGLSFGALELVKYLKDSNPDQQWLSIVSVVLINIFNRLIWNILLNVVLLEENNTKTINIISVMNKSYVSQMINIILIPIIINVAQDNNIDGPTGLAGQVHDFQLTSFIFMVIFNLINIPHRITMLIQCIPCFRHLAIRYLCRITGEFDSYAEMRDALTFLYEPPLVPVAGLYVYITSIIGQAFFFCHLQPVLLFYLVVNLIFFHIINKYLILRMSKIPDLLEIMVFQTCVGFALNIPLFYGVSSIVFLALREDAKNFGYYIPSILCLVVWFMSIQNPFHLYQKLVDCLIEVFLKNKKTSTAKSKSQNKTEKTQIHFITDILAITEEDKETQKMQAEPLPLGFEVNQAFNKLGERGISKRKENYYGGIGTNDLFNFQSKINEVQGGYHNKNKDFCEKFNSEKEEIDMKMSMKTSVRMTMSMIRKKSQIKEAREIILFD